jgi:hypothetical protein
MTPHTLALIMALAATGQPTHHRNLGDLRLYLGNIQFSSNAMLLNY